MPTTHPTNTTRGAFPTWELHHRLDRALEWAGIDEATMAAELGVHPNSVHNYAAGRRRPKLALVKVWAAVTGVPLEWILDGDSPDGPTSADMRSNTGGYTDREHEWNFARDCDLIAA